MAHKYQLIFFCIIIWLPLRSQDFFVKGILLDQDSHEPIAYANIGIIGENVGTVSSENGTFELLIPRQYSNEELTFSSVTHEPLRQKIRELLNVTDITILLKEKIIRLQAVNITAKKVKKKYQNLGIKRIPKFKWGAYYTAEFGEGTQIARLIETEDYPVFLSKTRLNLKFNTSDSLLIRVRVLRKNLVDGTPDSDVLLKDAIFNISNKMGWIELDMEPFNVVLTENFFISIEFIYAPFQDGKFFAITNILTKKSDYNQFIRLKSFSDWINSSENDAEVNRIYALGVTVYRTK